MSEILNVGKTGNAAQAARSVGDVLKDIVDEKKIGLGLKPMETVNVNGSDIKVDADKIKALLSGQNHRVNLVQ